MNRTCVVIFLSALSFFGRAEEKWKAPENPKDDKHWYPELPDNKEPYLPLCNGEFETKADPEKNRPDRPKGWAHPDGLTTIWKDDNYYNSRSMDVYICKLRKLLSKDPNITIINIHGKGYRIIVS